MSGAWSSCLRCATRYPVMAWLMVAATIVIVFNLLADVVYAYIDPRIRYD